MAMGMAAKAKIRQMNCRVNRTERSKWNFRYRVLESLSKSPELAVQGENSKQGKNIVPEDDIVDRHVRSRSLHEAFETANRL